MLNTKNIKNTSDIENYCDIFYSDMANVVSVLDTADMSEQDIELLEEACEANSAGLCHGLHFLGDTLITFAANDVVEFTPESLCQLGHCLVAISSLLPMLFTLYQKTNKETQLRSL
ncbi:MULTISPECIES: hypothetical protein [Photorhabdus]|uniref:Uncharacterized protein n=2 Tax=Photorhabdus khanii TaxID=1004150 RepID=W3VCH2_9GAMM|nr:MULTISPECIES: hypothetical protein [Photorhabdus]ETS32820.1 hypothetical protein PTE_00911 [Photorhabdus khanii NC19]MQL48737.1 hypothetical protein [Photorhabdus khanii]RAW95591.1 hypothetical protein CKY03_17265 [Photorhabdus sp. S9-53]RAW96009.1 hypothetical protein CKY05_16505 [Photorhabdus sp. S10-54]RAX00002.1 hypothetical protein CKY04_17030 [Photorhabdus sp. S8-52]